MSWCAVSDGNGIPLWSMPPHMSNVMVNTLVGWLEPLSVCIVVFEDPSGTCLVIHDGSIAYAVTECLIKV